MATDSPTEEGLLRSPFVCFLQLQLPEYDITAEMRGLDMGFIIIRQVILNWLFQKL